MLLTHIHPDHAIGLVDAAAPRSFPNAELIVHEEEAASGSAASPRQARPSASAATSARPHATAPYRERMRSVPDGEALPGVSAMLLPGHTPGHTGWLVHSGRDGVLIWGDVVHIPAIQVPRPEAALVFDVDPEAARATRRRTSTGSRPIGYGRRRASRFSGLRHIVRKGASYRFEPDA